MLNNINPNKAPGPDGIHGKVLKNCATSIAQPLSILFNLSYRTGQIPNEWKSANVVPVFKKGDKSSVENYRPISLTCLVMKIFERCIRDELMLKCNDLLDKRQHGFLPKMSCTTQMVPFVESLAVTLNESSRADIIYFDFAKAFDTVSHDIILHKLKYHYKIDGILLNFLKSYLQDRTQRVVIGGSFSESMKVSSGVPQGSIIGPTLFIMFINDMISKVSTGTNIVLYADDTKIWRRVESWRDHEQLQEDITSLYKWSIHNKMVFHPNKCKVLVVTRQHIQYNLPFERFGYHLNGTYLDYVCSEKDLGEYIANNLLWGIQCENLITTANSRLGLVRRTLHFTKNQKQKRVFYLSLIRSIFEHCSVIWRPYTAKHMIKFDHLQKRAVKWILSEHTASYSDREFLNKQHQLDLLPMNNKFTLTDLILFHKIVYKQVNIDMPSYLVRLSPESVRAPRNQPIGSEPRTLTSDIHPDNIIKDNDCLHFKSKITPKVDAYKYSFFHRTHLEWNKLPIKLRNYQDPDGFKVLLTEHMWKILIDKPD